MPVRDAARSPRRYSSVVGLIGGRLSPTCSQSAENDRLGTLSRRIRRDRRDFRTAHARAAAAAQADGLRIDRDAQGTQTRGGENGPEQSAGAVDSMSTHDATLTDFRTTDQGASWIDEGTLASPEGSRALGGEEPRVQAILITASISHAGVSRATTISRTSANHNT